ncbi:MAG: Transcriptional regulator, AcrR family, partial [uncultured Solirubrobacteraceae bacterium]
DPRRSRDARPGPASAGRRGGRPQAPRQPDARVDPRHGRRPRVHRGPRRPDDRPPRHRARHEQERAVRALRLEGGAPARDDRRRPPALRRQRRQAVTRAAPRARAGRAPDERLARLLPRRDLPRRLLLQHRQGGVRQPLDGPGARCRHGRRARVHRVPRPRGPQGAGGRRPRPVDRPRSARVRARRRRCRRQPALPAHARREGLRARGDRHPHAARRCGYGRL